MIYDNLKYHFKPQKGWVNDPNGLVYFKGYYHVFFQHAPNYERPWNEPMHWGHARTKDFLNWEELPVALYPDKDYDKYGCWSGTAIVKDDVLYLFYAGISTPDNKQATCVAYSTDGINFEKYEHNPVIAEYPVDGGPDFRDPAVCFIDGKYYCVMASGNPETKKGVLLLYESEDIFNWQYKGVMCQWDNCKYTECPSFVHATDGKYLLSASVCPLEYNHYFSIMYGTFKDGKFVAEYTSQVDKGPDQYAGQIFTDHKGRNILISWIPGWNYAEFTDHNIGCMSIPRELKLIDGKIHAYPIEEVQHLLKDTDQCIEITRNGFIIKRTDREPVIYKGKTDDIKILRDNYIAEVFVNGDEEVYSILL